MTASEMSRAFVVLGMGHVRISWLSGQWRVTAELRGADNLTLETFAPTLDEALMLTINRAAKVRYPEED